MPDHRGRLFQHVVTSGSHSYGKPNHDERRSLLYIPTDLKGEGSLYCSFRRDNNNNVPFFLSSIQYPVSILSFLFVIFLWEFCYVHNDSGYEPECSSRIVPLFSVLPNSVEDLDLQKIP